MNIKITLHVLGGLLLFLGITLLTPLPFSIYYADGQILTFVLSAAVTSLIGGLLFTYFRSCEEISLREGFAIATFTWIAFAIFGALPFLLSGSLSHPIDAFFEAMSGFTTVGASVYTNVEAVPKSVLFWRALTHWIGGMGIIVLGVAILPLLGVGGMQLYEAETPGPTADRLTPRIQDTARLLWGVYALITLAGIGFLWLGEMDLFEAICHTFAAIATGGFSTRNASLGAFSHYSQIVTIILMVLGGANFALHFFALSGKFRKYWASDEFRCYIGFLLSATAIIFLANWTRYDKPQQNLLDSAFTVTSIMTTTGFATANYEGWVFVTQGILFSLMFIGGCASSTAGGLKHVRIVMLFKHLVFQTGRLLHPRQVKVLKLDHRPVSPEIMQDVLGFTILYLGVFAIGSLLLATSGLDLLTASSAVIANLGTIGPGLGAVGPMDNYSSIPYFAKIVLSICMLLGRLEIYTVVVLFYATFWKK